MVQDRRLLAVAVVIGTFLSTLFAGVAVSREMPESYDAKIMLQVTRSLVENGNFVVTEDEFGFNTPYASYGLGQSLLFAGPYAVGKQLGANPASAAMVTNAIAFALTAVALLALGRLLDLRWGQACTVSFLASFGTMLFPYVATGFAEVALAGTVTVGLIGLAATRAAKDWGPMVAGLGAGAAALFRADSLVLVAVPVALGVWVVASGRRSSAVLGFTLGALPFLAVLGWYNNLRFGSPFELGYSEADAGFTHPIMRGLRGLLLSPGRGLIWYVPLVAVALLGAWAAWRRHPAVAAVAAVLVAGRVVLFAKWSAWPGGVCWGPRFLVPAMPALAVGLAEVVRHWGRFRRWWVLAKLPVVAVVAASIGVQVVGATIGYEYHWNRFHPAAEATGDPDRYIFSWDHSAIRDQAGWMWSQPALYVGRALPPGSHSGIFGAFLAMVVWGGAAAAASSWRFHRGPARSDRDRPLLEDELLPRHVDPDRVPVAVAAFQEREREGVGDAPLDEPFEWPSSVGGIEALLGEPDGGFFGDLEPEPALPEPVGQVPELDVEDAADVVPAERPEPDDLVDAVEKLRTEELLWGDFQVRRHDQDDV